MTEAIGIWSVGAALTANLSECCSGGVRSTILRVTINAEQHPLMRQFHKPADEKRMVVILPEDRYDDWLRADARGRVEFLRAYPAEALEADAPAERVPSLLED